MPNILPFRIVNSLQAAQFASATAGRENQITPRRIEAGPYINQYAFSENVMFDPVHADLHDILRVAAPNATVLDVDAVWPVEEGL